MSSKRTREERSNADAAPAHPSKKPRTGFRVGPDHLPDGTYKRRVQKIKKDLIHKAKVRREYARVLQDSAGHDDAPGAALHPERQSMIAAADERDRAEPTPSTPDGGGGDNEAAPRRRRRPKAVPFRREARYAERQREEAEARRKAREEAEEQRRKKHEERERFRRAMAKARTGGRGGQRKLGRESKVLLERVQRMVNE